MERATNEHFSKISLRDEHEHRYQLAARVSRGLVVDCACGIGYGSQIIASQAEVKGYLGIDPASHAIEEAVENYSGKNIRFERGTVEECSCSDSSIDTFLMFETLEHTKSPSRALEKVYRYLKPDGLLIGSVPSAEYEKYCESIYGVNPFHLHKFSEKEIIETLSQHFSSVRIFSMEFILGSLVQSLNPPEYNVSEIIPATTFDEPGIFGSIVFLAGAEERVHEATNQIGEATKFLTSIPKAVSDRQEIMPIQIAIQSIENRVDERDKVIIGQTKMVDERDKVIIDQAKMLDEQLGKISSLENMLHKRDWPLKHIFARTSWPSHSLHLLFSPILKLLQRN